MLTRSKHSYFALTSLSVAIPCFYSHCLFIQKGIQQVNTFILVIIGGLMLYGGLRIFMRHVGSKQRASLRFALGLLAGLLIFLA